MRYNIDVNKRRKTLKTGKGKTMTEWMLNYENHDADYEELQELLKKLAEESEG